jgi:hypothetical protein
LFRSNVSPDQPLRPKPPVTSNYRPSHNNYNPSPVGGFELGRKNSGN